MKYAYLAALAAASSFASSAQAVVVDWADLTSATANSVSGIITHEGEEVGVTFEGPVYFANTNGGTNYWYEGSPKPYTGGIVENAPGTSDIIAISTGGVKTIKFSRRVTDVYLALISWNGNAGIFDQPFEVISAGCGHYGCGTFTSVTTTTFTANGELHGIIRFTGEFDQVSFTDRNELWHGIQIGIGDVVPQAGVPEPASWALMIGGFDLAGGVMRRRRANVVFA